MLGDKQIYPQLILSHKLRCGTGLSLQVTEVQRSPSVILCELCELVRRYQCGDDKPKSLLDISSL